MQLIADYSDCTHSLTVKHRDKITGQTFVQSAKVDEYLALDNKSIMQTMLGQLVKSVTKAAHPIVSTPHVSTPPGLMSSADLATLHGFDYGQTNTTVTTTGFVPWGNTTNNTTTGPPWNGTPDYVWVSSSGANGGQWEPAHPLPASHYPVISINPEFLSRAKARRAAKKSKLLPALKPATRKLILL